MITCRGITEGPEPEIIHLRIATVRPDPAMVGVPLCGTKAAELRWTNLPTEATCPKCIDRIHES